MLAALGLDKLVVDGKESAAQKVLSPEELAAMVKTSDGKGVELFAAPKIITLAGLEAEVNVTRQTIIQGVSHEVGPSIRIAPRLSSDGASFDLSLVAKLRHAASNP